MSYNHTTRLQLRNLILGRLGDSVFWTSAEIDRYINEVLRTFNSLAQFNYDRGTLDTSANQTFYDLPSLLDKSGEKILQYSVSDQDLFLDMKYSLLEDISSASTWTGTSQFTAQQCQDALEKARNEFLLKTNLVQTHLTQNIPSPLTSRLDLDDSIIDLSRVAYLSNAPSSSYIPLKRIDELSASAWTPNWNLNDNDPSGFSFYLSPKVSIQLIPIATNGGLLDIVALQNPSSLSLATGNILNIPDDFSWAIKYKALFYLLSKDGEATDQFRASYCQSRFEEAILAARISSTVQQGYINDQSLILSSLEDLDQWTPSWQSTISQPDSIALAGRNLIALSPTPDDVYSLTFDVVRNAPVPSSDGDFIQVGEEHLSALVDYAVHIAMFKVGGGEFMNTLPLKDNFYRLCMENNQRLAAIAPNFQLLKKQSFKQEIQVAEYSTAS